MCGIVGFIDKSLLNKNFINRNSIDKKSLDKQVLMSMMDQIIHRGPDGSGMYLDNTIALGHRRLSIIDLEGGIQPMKNEDGTLICIFNGEIYNFKELRNVLEEKGHVFATESDTEVLLHGYEEWKKDLPKKLRGMFAFAIWDNQKQELFCARDYFGIKPFYYYNKDNVFLFGSEIKSFLPHPHFEKRFNKKQLELYLTYQYSPGNTTFFENVYKLLPAHYLFWKEDTIEIQQYWKPEFLPDASKSKEEWEMEIEKVMQKSVLAHKISDVEVGSFLSSGVDSSYVTSLADVKRTFTIGFEHRTSKHPFQKHRAVSDRTNVKKLFLEKSALTNSDSSCSNEKYNEAKYAHEFSQSINVKNTIYQVSAKEFFEKLPEIQYYMDEPLADAASVALYFLNREASREVKVCLSGEGADELFAGYNIYKEPFMCQCYERLPAFLRKSIGVVASLFPAITGVNFLIRHSKPVSQRYIGTTSLFTEKQKKKLIKNFSGKIRPIDVAAPYFKCLEHRNEDDKNAKSVNTKSMNTKGTNVKSMNMDGINIDHAGFDKRSTKGLRENDVTCMQFVDLHLWLAGDILLKADKMSMANSLELRVPFLDIEVFEVARKLPVKYRVNAKETKIALRGAAGKRIGEKNAKREKLGFPVPVKEWLREEPYSSLVREAFESPIAETFFHIKRLEQLLNQHISGKRDNWRQIWCVYMFLVWYQEYFGEDR